MTQTQTQIDAQGVDLARRAMFVRLGLAVSAFCLAPALLQLSAASASGRDGDGESDRGDSDSDSDRGDSDSDSDRGDSDSDDGDRDSESDDDDGDDDSSAGVDGGRDDDPQDDGDDDDTQGGVRVLSQRL